MDDKERLIEAVESHFANELDVEPHDVVGIFLRTKKDPDQDKEPYGLRGPKTRMRTPQNQ